MKKVLMIATVPSMIGQFNMNNISILLDLGYEVHVACDWKDRSVWTNEKIYNLKDTLDNLNVKYFQIDYSRHILNLWNHFQSYKQTLKLLEENKYDFIHCHTPIASAIARLVCKKTKTKCIYTAHGFHFFNGAPIQNWLIFYPIEKLLSRYTDILITINKEDYNRAKKKFKMKKLEYVPGVGIDINSIKSIVVDQQKIKNELNIPINNKVIISVGELSKRKNHEIVIKALKDKKNITYIICGQGDLKDYLNDLAKQYNVDLRLLGFRSDRIELMKISDIFVFPSLQEGLPVALMEAMACELPCIVSNIRGNNDLICDNIFLFDPKKIQSVSLTIENVMYMIFSSTSKKTLENIKSFDLYKITKLMKNIYSDV